MKSNKYSDFVFYKSEEKYKRKKEIQVYEHVCKLSYYVSIKSE